MEILTSEIKIEEILDAFFKCVSKLQSNDKHLLKIHQNSKDKQQVASERSVNAKLLQYLSIELDNSFHLNKKIDVDMEYNLDYAYENMSKSLGILKKLKDLNADFESDKYIVTYNARVFPDLIVHQRGTVNNFLTVEIKKGNSSLSDIENDRLKLEAYTSQNDGLQYKLGILLTYMSNESGAIFEFEYFQDGKAISKSSMFDQIKVIEKAYFPNLPSYLG